MEKECKLIEENWSFYGVSAKVISFKQDGQYRISDLIDLLEIAKEKFGDQEILIKDSSGSSGFSRIGFSDTENPFAFIDHF